MIIKITYNKWYNREIANEVESNPMWFIFLFALGLGVASWLHYEMAKRLMGKYMGGGYSLVLESWACGLTLALFTMMIGYSGIAALLLSLWLAGSR